MPWLCHAEVEGTQTDSQLSARQTLKRKLGTLPAFVHWLLDSCSSLRCGCLAMLSKAQPAEDDDTGVASSTLPIPSRVCLYLSWVGLDGRETATAQLVLQASTFSMRSSFQSVRIGTKAIPRSVIVALGAPGQCGVPLLSWLP
ncbi:unnamed protein product [Polarella glacialis]|uniref:Uncharacterized protein n=1 Tax=Polarella glacialis TaxID=89957 RepID=A0A813JUX3_POLGL|nr:unnamed protein product [Polarella glacialis]